jgi:hypothetical protein
MPEKLTPYRLSTPEEAILRAVLRYGISTADQLARLLWRRTSLTWVQTMLKALADHGYLARDRVPKKGDAPFSPLYYGLTGKGLRQLRDLGVTDLQRARPYRVGEYTHPHIIHTLASNEVGIATELLCKHYPTIQLARLFSEAYLKRHPVSVPTPGGGSTKYSADGFLDVELHHTQRRKPILVEVDLGSEHQVKWRQKVETILHFMAGPYEAAFQRRSLTVAVIAGAKPERLAALRTWTEATLTETNAAAEVIDRFRFAYAPLTLGTPSDQLLTPDHLFFGERWYAPFATTAEALLTPPA